MAIAILVSDDQVKGEPPAPLQEKALDVPGLVSSLRALALTGLGRMYRPDIERFVFRVRQTSDGVLGEGRSDRYTAISLIGLAGETTAAAAGALGSVSRSTLCSALVRDVGTLRGLGDVALTLWACGALGNPGREMVLARLREFQPQEGTPTTVELAWTLAALCDGSNSHAPDLRGAVARRLVESFVERSALFPHVVGTSRWGLRSHVCCFADLVYPIHALSLYARMSGDRAALAVATRCAERLVRLQGPEGQWWWHYDVRTGAVIERYPVYSVHQDAMAPLALFALEEASGLDFSEPIARGLTWLRRSPELAGGSLIDEKAGFIWRKVGRHEPWKLSRTLQALASRLDHRLRVPGLGVVLPPGAVDYENRPYHLGWLLYAWPDGPVGTVRARRTQ
jgi:hypothetical protein